MAQALNAESLLESLDKESRQRVVGARSRLERFINKGLVHPQEITGQSVLDWECGDGTFAVALLLFGAKEVVGLDTWLDVELTHTRFGRLPSAISFHKMPIGDFVNHELGKGRHFDTVFTCNVTEHLPEIEKQIESVAQIVKPGGVFMVNHHNYYHAIGHHDFMFLETSAEGVRSKAPRCWESSVKCASSDEFRRREMNMRPWMWPRSIDQLRDPENCDSCPHFLRAKPWAHLIHASAARRMYPRGFFSGKSGSTLNKITNFQLGQALVEVGFEIEFAEREFSINQPPPELLEDGFFTETELKTFMYRLRCRRHSGEERREKRVSISSIASRARALPYL